MLILNIVTDNFMFSAVEGKEICYNDEAIKQLITKNGQIYANEVALNSVLNNDLQSLKVAIKFCANLEKTDSIFPSFESSFGHRLLSHSISEDYCEISNFFIKEFGKNYLTAAVVLAINHNKINYLKEITNKDIYWYDENPEYNPYYNEAKFKILTTAFYTQDDEIISLIVDKNGSVYRDYAILQEISIYLKHQIINDDLNLLKRISTSISSDMAAEILGIMGSQYFNHHISSKHYNEIIKIIDNAAKGYYSGKFSTLIVKQFIDNNILYPAIIFNYAINIESFTYKYLPIITGLFSFISSKYFLEKNYDQITKDIGNINKNLINVFLHDATPIPSAVTNLVIEPYLEGSYDEMQANTFIDLTSNILTGVAYSLTAYLW